jgi:single-strand DNA-binding protein
VTLVCRRSRDSPTLADGRRAPLRSRLYGFTSGRHPGTAEPKGRSSLNNIQLIGRLTRAARFAITNGDKARANFTVAVDGYNDQTTSYVPITCFGKLAENVAEYTDKGHLIAIEGRIASGKYTNDQGETVYTLDVIATNVKFLKAPNVATTTPVSVEGEVA